MADPLRLPTSGPRTATAGDRLSVTLAAMGGRAPYTFVLSGHPAWLSVDTSGTVTGISEVWSGAVTVTATDADGRTATQSVTFTVEPSQNVSCATFQIDGTKVRGVYNRQVNPTTCQYRTLEGRVTATGQWLYVGDNGGNAWCSAASGGRWRMVAATSNNAPGQWWNDGVRVNSNRVLATIDCGP